MIWILIILVSVGAFVMAVCCLLDENKRLKSLMCKRCQKKLTELDRQSDIGWEDDGYSM